jgi:pectinesterase
MFRKSLLLIALACRPAVAVVAEGTNRLPQKIKIVLIGDSTVTDNAGWGLGFKQFLGTNVGCINASHGGESSLSFMRDGRWTNALALKGDYYLIQFGHNNQPGKPGRSTDRATYVANLKQYVDDTRALGAQPVFITPLTRREWDKAQPGKIKSGLAPYADEVRKIAAEKQVPLVELQARSLELCESLGPEKCLAFSPFKMLNDQPRHDGTHLNARGSVRFARLVVDELRKNVPALAALFRTEPPPDDPVLQYAVIVMWRGAWILFMARPPPCSIIARFTAGMAVISPPPAPRRTSLTALCSSTAN